ncbi:hypothetical protein BRADI_3g54375v3 [Brachypodium distachyon]|uniref:BTB domain-containing protein n=1 Tax=Brachypodium distachyon TaxID=15368 RepID=A0A0Q3I5R4_BRADI|nr:hypothetical protein BRADI_3g54375v3 [Brachypodium distachyon]
MSSSGGQPSRSASAIVADRSSGHHLLRIHDYSLTKGVPTGEFISSISFSVGGQSWHINYYPNGMRADDLAPVKAQFEFNIVDEAEEDVAPPMAHVSVDTLVSRRGWSYPTFAKRADLESSEHLRDDSFTIRCDIVVVNKHRAEDQGAAFVSMPPCDLGRHLGNLLETEKGADVVFEVGGKSFAAHRCVLAARSSVFAAELFGPMKEGNTALGVVRIQDMEAEVFKALLHFAYTGSLLEMPKEDENMACQHLLVAADRYGMERLKLMCEQKLCELIDVGTVANVLALAEQHHCAGLKKACFGLLASPKNMKAVVATDGFKHLSRSCPSLMVELFAMSLAPC